MVELCDIIKRTSFQFIGLAMSKMFVTVLVTNDTTVIGNGYLMVLGNFFVNLS